MSGINGPTPKQISKLVALRDRFNYLKVEADQLSREAHNLRLDAKRTHNPAQAKIFLNTANAKEHQGKKISERYNRMLAKAYKPTVVERLINLFKGKK